MKNDHPHFFEEKRKHTIVDKSDGQWKIFEQHERMSDRASLSMLAEIECPTFEETMLMDTISSIRKDIKE